MRSEKSIRRADLCVLVIDATMGVTAQDKKIAGQIQEARKPCVVAVNKWDLIGIEGDRKEFLHEFMDGIRSRALLPRLRPGDSGLRQDRR